MKMSGFYDESISNGLGWRAVLFVSGCPHHCPGCHNKETQDFDYGTEFTDEEKNCSYKQFIVGWRNRNCAY